MPEESAPRPTTAGVGACGPLAPEPPAADALPEETGLPTAGATSSDPPQPSALLRNGSTRRSQGKYYTVLYDYKAAGEDELTLRKGERVILLSDDVRVSGDEGWWTGKIHGKVGIFPLNFVACDSPSDPTATAGANVFVAEDANDVVERGYKRLEGAFGSGGNALDGATNAAATTGAPDGGSRLVGETLETSGLGSATESCEHDAGPPRIAYEEIGDVSDLIGRGGFCKVYVGKYRGETVAVKALDPQDPAATLDAIHKEGGLFWQLRHPNIVRLLGMCLHPPDYWLVMEFCAGGALNKVLEKHQLTLRILTNWAIQIAQGMEYVHGQNVIHRDLKPSNVLLSVKYSDESCDHIVLKITDFGLSRVGVRSTVLSGGGTCAYMAPENIRAQKFSKKSDVWSFGVVVWELLTGQIPYKDINHAAIMYGIGCHTLSLPIPETCPDNFRKFMEDCWQKDPKSRPSFSAIVLRLQEIASSPFVATAHDSFDTLRTVWREEIERVLADVCKREDQLTTREKELNRIARELEISRREIEKREREVRQREVAAAAAAVVAAAAANGVVGGQTPPTPRKRQGKFLRRRNGSSNNIEISNPTDFKHNVSWANLDVTERLAALQLAQSRQVVPGLAQPAAFASGGALGVPAVSMSPNIGLNRFRSRTTSTDSVSSPLLGRHPSPGATRAFASAFSNASSPSGASSSSSAVRLHSVSPKLSRVAVSASAGGFSDSQSCSSSASSLAPNSSSGPSKGKTWGPSTLSTTNLQWLQANTNSGSAPVAAVNAAVSDSPLLIVNPVAASVGDSATTLLMVGGQPTPPTESAACSREGSLGSGSGGGSGKSKHLFGLRQVKATLNNVLSSMGLKDRRSNGKLQKQHENSHSKSYDELGLGEHMAEPSLCAFDDSHIVRGGELHQPLHQTYHGHLTHRISAVRPSLFKTGGGDVIQKGAAWAAGHTSHLLTPPSTTLAVSVASAQAGASSPSTTKRRRSSTTSHDSDQAYNSASSGFGPSPIGNATLTTPLHTSDYPFTPSSAELMSTSSADTLCLQQHYSQHPQQGLALSPMSTVYPPSSQLEISPTSAANACLQINDPSCHIPLCSLESTISSSSSAATPPPAPSQGRSGAYSSFDHASSQQHRFTQQTASSAVDCSTVSEVLAGDAGNKNGQAAAKMASTASTGVSERLVSTLSPSAATALGMKQASPSSPVVVPSSSLSSASMSSVLDNPGAASRSPPRTPQLYARNMSTPNANAYKIHGSPYSARRRPSVLPEVQHVRQSQLDRPSTLNLTSSIPKPSTSPATASFATGSNKRAPVTVNHHRQHHHHYQHLVVASSSSSTAVSSSASSMSSSTLSSTSTTFHHRQRHHHEHQQQLHHHLLEKQAKQGLSHFQVEREQQQENQSKHHASHFRPSGNSGGTPTPDRTPPETLEENLSLSLAAGSRQPLHFPSNIYLSGYRYANVLSANGDLADAQKTLSGPLDATSGTSIFENDRRAWLQRNCHHEDGLEPPSVPISPAPPTPPGGCTPDRKPTVRELEEEFSFSL